VTVVIDLASFLSQLYSKKSGKKNMLTKLQEITGVLGAAKKGLPMFGMHISKVAILEGTLMPSIVEKSIRYLEHHGESMVRYHPSNSVLT